MDSFTVDLPWGFNALPDNAQPDEIEIILLQQDIISSLKADAACREVWYQSTREQNSVLRAQLANRDAVAGEQAIAAMREQLVAEYEQRIRDIKTVHTNQMLAQEASKTESVRLLADEKAALVAQIEHLTARNGEFDQLAAAVAVAQGELRESIATLQQENAQLKLRLNEANQLIDNQRETQLLMEDACKRATEIAKTETERSTKMHSTILNMSVELKQEKERSALVSTAFAAFSLDPALKIEGKGQLHMLDVVDCGVYGEMKKMLGIENGVLWLWVDSDGYGHPVGLNANGDLVTGCKSRTYFLRRMGVAARTELIETLLKFDSRYYNELTDLTTQVYAQIAIKGTTLKEEIVAYVRDLELLPDRQKAFAQLRTLQSQIDQLRKVGETAVKNFRVRMTSGNTTATTKKKKKRR